MPTFEIPDGAPTTLDLKRSPDGSATGSIVFKVTNKSTDAMSGRLSVVPSGSSQEGWFAIDGDRERNFAAGETQDAKITVTAPKDVASGEYPFKLRAVAVNDPDNDHTEGPVTTAKVPAPPPPPKPPRWWLWILIGLLVLAVLGVGGYFLVKALKGDDGGDGNNVAANNSTSSEMKPVPNFVDKTVEQAKAESQGFNITEQAGAPTGKAPRTVLSQVPAAASRQAAGAVVQLTFDPGVTVPSIVGQNAAQAIRTLQGVPLHIQTSTTRCENSGTPDAIIDQDPKAGAVVPKDSGVNVVVRTVGGVFGTIATRCGIRLPPKVFLDRAKTVQMMSINTR